MNALLKLNILPISRTNHRIRRKVLDVGSIMSVSVIHAGLQLTFDIIIIIFNRSCLINRTLLSKNSTQVSQGPHDAPRHYKTLFKILIDCLTNDNDSLICEFRC